MKQGLKNYTLYAIERVVKPGGGIKVICMRLLVIPDPPSLLFFVLLLFLHVRNKLFFYPSG